MPCDTFLHRFNFPRLYSRYNIVFSVFPDKWEVLGALDALERSDYVYLIRVLLTFWNGVLCRVMVFLV